LSTKPDTEEPSHNLDDYRDGQDKRRIGQLHGIISGYFEKLKRGDLVMVPPSAFSSPAYIGEVISLENEYITTHIPLRYGESLLTGRRVRWLGHIEKRKLPNDILDATVFHHYSLWRYTRMRLITSLSLIPRSALSAARPRHRGRKTLALELPLRRIDQPKRAGTRRGAGPCQHPSPSQAPSPR
jgi:hypothetical protein